MANPAAITTANRNSIRRLNFIVSLSLCHFAAVTLPRSTL
jgi:hypothetical protein